MFVHHQIISSVKRVEFVSVRLSYIVLRGRWCNIIVLNAHAPSEEKTETGKANKNVSNCNIQQSPGRQEFV